MAVKVSVIVPVYNVELYLEECLDSIINQTFKEIEIILVNDGSTDSSSEIIEFYALKDSRIVILTQPNGGVSVARNTGIKKASGKYILFVDSDDTLLSNSIEVLYQKAEETGADIVIGNALRCYPDGSQTLYFPHGKTLSNGLLWTGESVFTKLMEWDMLPLAVSYFTRKDIIIDNKLLFQENILHEDEIWCVKTILAAQKVLFIEFNYYFYWQRENSIMNSDNKAFRIKSLFEVAKALYQHSEALQVKDISEKAISCIYVRIFWICHFIYSLVFQNKTVTFTEFNYFSGLLIRIYPALSYSQQRYCLSKLCVSRVLSELSYETDTNLSIYD